MLLDVFRPASVDGALPAIVWVHGGGWLGGSKDGARRLPRARGEQGLRGRRTWLCARAGASLSDPAAAGHAGLGYLRANAERLHLDPDRIVIAGDSSGAQIAAQVGALVTTPGYSDELGIAPTITRRQLRGLVLACGPYASSWPARRTRRPVVAS